MYYYDRSDGTVRHTHSVLRVWAAWVLNRTVYS